MRNISALFFKSSKVVDELKNHDGQHLSFLSLVSWKFRMIKKSSDQQGNFLDLGHKLSSPKLK